MKIFWVGRITYARFQLVESQPLGQPFLYCGVELNDA